MITVTKIANKESTFLLNYYLNGNHKIILVDETTLVNELNKGWEAINKAQEDYNLKAQSERMQNLGQGAACNIGSTAIPSLQSQAVESTI